LATACSGLAAFLQQQQQQPQSNPAVAELLSPATTTWLLAVWVGIAAGRAELSSSLDERCLLTRDKLLPTVAPACKLATAALRHLQGAPNAAGMAAAAAAAAVPANTGSSSSGGGGSSSSSSWSWRTPSSTAELAKQVVRVSSYVSVLMFQELAVRKDPADMGEVASVVEHQYLDCHRWLLASSKLLQIMYLSICQRNLFKF
jgi:hypothetical protein